MNKSAISEQEDQDATVASTSEKNIECEIDSHDDDIVDTAQLKDIETTRNEEWVGVINLNDPATGKNIWTQTLVHQLFARGQKK